MNPPTNKVDRPHVEFKPAKRKTLFRKKKRHFRLGSRRISSSAVSKRSSLSSQYTDATDNYSTPRSSVISSSGWSVADLFEVEDPSQDDPFFWRKYRLVHDLTRAPNDLLVDTIKFVFGFDVLRPFIIKLIVDRLQLRPLLPCVCPSLSKPLTPLEEQLFEQVKHCGPSQPETLFSLVRQHIPFLEHPRGLQIGLSGWPSPHSEDKDRDIKALCIFVFQFLCTSDHRSASLVCRSWLYCSRLKESRTNLTIRIRNLPIFPSYDEPSSGGGSAHQSVDSLMTPRDHAPAVVLSPSGAGPRFASKEEPSFGYFFSNRSSLFANIADLQIDLDIPWAWHDMRVVNRNLLRAQWDMLRTLLKLDSLRSIDLLFPDPYILVHKQRKKNREIRPGDLVCVEASTFQSVPAQSRIEEIRLGVRACCHHRTSSRNLYLLDISGALAVLKDRCSRVKKLCLVDVACGQTSSTQQSVSDHLPRSMTSRGFSDSSQMSRYGGARMLFEFLRANLVSLEHLELRYTENVFGIDSESRSPSPESMSANSAYDTRNMFPPARQMPTAQSAPLFRQTSATKPPIERYIERPATDSPAYRAVLELTAAVCDIAYVTTEVFSDYIETYRQKEAEYEVLKQEHDEQMQILLQSKRLPSPDSYESDLKVNRAVSTNSLSSSQNSVLSSPSSFHRVDSRSSIGRRSSYRPKKPRKSLFGRSRSVRTEEPKPVELDIRRSISVPLSKSPSVPVIQPLEELPPMLTKLPLERLVLEYPKLMAREFVHMYSVLGCSQHIELSKVSVSCEDALRSLIANTSLGLAQPNDPVFSKLQYLQLPKLTYDPIMWAQIVDYVGPNLRTIAASLKFRESENPLFDDPMLQTSLDSFMHRPTLKRITTANEIADLFQTNEVRYAHNPIENFLTSLCKCRNLEVISLEFQQEIDEDDPPVGNARNHLQLRMAHSAEQHLSRQPVEKTRNPGQSLDDLYSCEPSLPFGCVSQLVLSLAMNLREIHVRFDEINVESLNVTEDFFINSSDFDANRHGKVLRYNSRFGRAFNSEVFSWFRSCRKLEKISFARRMDQSGIGMIPSKCSCGVIPRDPSSFSNSLRVVDFDERQSHMDLPSIDAINPADVSHSQYDIYRVFDQPGMNDETRERLQSSSHGCIKYFGSLNSVFLPKNPVLKGRLLPRRMNLPKLQPTASMQSNFSQASNSVPSLLVNVPSSKKSYRIRVTGGVSPRTPSASRSISHSFV